MAICEVDSVIGKKYAKDLEKETQHEIVLSVAEIYASFGDAEDLEFFHEKSKTISGYVLFSFIQSYGEYVSKQSDEVLLSELAYFRNISIDETAWWVRLSGQLMIMTNHGEYLAKVVELKNALSAMDASNSNYESVNSELASKQKVFDALNKIWNEISESEKHPRLTSIIQEYNSKLKE